MRSGVLFGTFFGVLPTVLIILIIVFSVREQVMHDEAIARYHAKCAEQGGHIYLPDKTSFCVSQDGRWVEIYP